MRVSTCTMHFLCRLFAFCASKVRIKHVPILLLIFGVLAFFGAFTHVLEEDFYESFKYPLNEDIRVYVEQLKRHELPSQKPINGYNYSYISQCNTKCSTSAGEKLRLVYIVKSATEHFDRRQAIRNSWGFEKRFSDVLIRRIFVLGVQPGNDALQRSIELEAHQYGDIVQVNFIDSYYNNTIKTMIGFKWAYEFCPNSKFYMFSDDDMYVSTKNVLRFVRNPTQYPDYLIQNAYQFPILEQKLGQKEVNEKYSKTITIEKNSKVNKTKYEFVEYEISETALLFAGFVFVSSPHRHYSSKWHVSLSEYPYHMWPPYVTAGAYVLSHDALIDMYLASFFTKHFRFDDIYLSILALKMKIEPFHCNEFYFYKKAYNIHSYRFVVASHGYGDPQELLHVWNQLRSGGYA